MIKTIYDTLMSVNDDLIKHGEYEGAISELDSVMDHLKVINYLINGVKTYDDLTIAVIKLIIEIAQAIYNNSGLKWLSDEEEYDKLYAVYNRLTGDEIVGTSVLEGEILKHKFPDLRGTVDKVHFFTEEERCNDPRESIEKWIYNIESSLGRKLTPDELECECFPKWDGGSVIMECKPTGELDRALSRGFTANNTAVNLTRFFKGSNFSFMVPEGNVLPFAVKTEVVVLEESFKQLQKIKDYKNKRNTVAGLLNTLDLPDEYLKFLTAIPIQIQYLGQPPEIPSFVYENFPVVKVKNIKNYDALRRAEVYIRKEVDDKIGSDIDGMVIRFTNKKLQELLGRRKAINNYEVAYKFPPEEKQTFIKDVIFEIGALGNVSANALIQPIKIRGNTVKSISLGSIDRVKDLQLAKGDEVIVKYDVVPYLYINDACARSGEEPVEIPKQCPYCGAELVYNPVYRCDNNECPSRMIGKILNYVVKMDIKELGEEKITLLFNEGFLKEIPDLYKLKDYKTIISEIPSMGKKSINLIVENIDKVKNVPDYVLLGSLGIPNCGRDTFKKIMDVYNLAELYTIIDKAKYAKLTEIKSIGPKIAKSLVIGLEHNRRIIEKLANYVGMTHEEPREYNTHVLFTNIRPSAGFSEYLKSKGVKICDGYNLKLDFIIHEGENNKTKKARDNNAAGKTSTNLISIDEAYKIFNYTE